MSQEPQNEPTLVAQLDGMTPQELRSWLAALLRGEISGIPGAVRAGYLPHALVVEVFPSLSPGVRQGIADAVSEWVRELARDRGSSWRSDAGDELLLLAQRVCGTRLIPQFLQLAEDSALLVAEEPTPKLDLHHRALQCLVAGKWRGAGDWQSAVEFWRSQALRSPRYAGTAFEGLAQIGPEHAVRLIGILPWNGSIPGDISRRLTWLLDQWGPATILPLVRDQLRGFVEPARQAITALFECEGLRLELPTRHVACSTRFQDFFARQHIPAATRETAGL